MSKKLEGIIDEITNQKTGNGKKGAWTLTNFTLIDGGGNVHKVQTFGDFNDDLVGAQVSIDAEYDAQYRTYKATSIEVAEGETVGAVAAPAAKPVAQTVAEPAKRRGRPAKATTANEAVAETVKSYEKNPPTPASTQAEPLAAGREAFRSAAMDAVKENLDAADLLLAEAKEATTADLIAVADMIGRTQTAMFMDQQKNIRGAAANERKSSYTPYKKNYYRKS